MQKYDMLCRKSVIKYYALRSSFLNTLPKYRYRLNFLLAVLFHPPCSSKISWYSSPISIVVSRQSATKAGEKTKSFLSPFFARSSIISSENGSIHPFPNLD